MKSERLINDLDILDQKNSTFQHIATRFFCRLAKKHVLFHRGSNRLSWVSLYLIKNGRNKLNLVRYQMTSPLIDRYHWKVLAPVVTNCNSVYHSSRISHSLSSQLYLWKSSPMTWRKRFKFDLHFVFRVSCDTVALIIYHNRLKGRLVYVTEKFLRQWIESRLESTISSLRKMFLLY